VSDHTGRIAQVVPDLATFAVDDGFAYAVPPELEVEIGSLVRVPLGTRRIRGAVVSLRSGDVESLKPLVAVSGDFPVFDGDLLQTLRWAALHYVAPLATLLSRAAPPNLPRGSARRPQDEVADLDSPLPQLSAAAADGSHVRPSYLVTGRDYAAHIAGLANAPVQAGRNVAVVAATLEEARRLAAELRAPYGDRVVFATSSMSDKELTKAWVAAYETAGVLVVGTPEIALWPLGKPSLWVVVEEGRRAMKAKQTPTLQVHELVRRRALVERSGMVLVGPVPTVGTLAHGAAVHELPGRVWPLVEVVDRREEPPGGRSLANRTLSAIRTAADDGGQVFVFVSRRGYAPAFRCVRCRVLRRCPHCGAGPDRGDRCRRCGAGLGPCQQCGGRRFEPLGAGIGRVSEELVRHVGEHRVGDVGSGRQIVVGSERDLPAVPEAALTVAVDADSLLLAPHFRAEEEALRLLARVALTVAPGRGRRLVLQTNQPDHRALRALRLGHPVGFLLRLAEERARDGLPPAGDLIAVHVTGDAAVATADIAALEESGVELHGPETVGDVTRWFLQGAALEEAKVRLRAMVQRWRDGGCKVRIDADPIDL
jgi:primosomal protein N' (replication factor Y)